MYIDIHPHVGVLQCLVTSHKHMSHTNTCVTQTHESDPTVLAFLPMLCMTCSSVACAVLFSVLEVGGTNNLIPQDMRSNSIGPHKVSHLHSRIFSCSSASPPAAVRLYLSPFVVPRHLICSVLTLVLLYSTPNTPAS